jgi:hypothetical protein
MAAVNNREFPMQLAHATTGPNSIEAKMERWATWLLNAWVSLMAPRRKGRWCNSPKHRLMRQRRPIAMRSLMRATSGAVT